MPPQPQDVLDMYAMIPTNARDRATCTKMVTIIGIEKLKDAQLQKNKSNPSMIATSRKLSWLLHNDHRRSAWYALHHIPVLLLLPMLKPHADWPLSTRLFWNNQRIMAHCAEQRVRECRSERKKGTYGRWWW